MSPADTVGVVSETLVPDLLYASAEAANLMAGPVPPVGLAVPVNGWLVAPWLSVTTRVKLCAPGCAYVWLGDAPVAVPPSLKVHA